MHKKIFIVEDDIFIAEELKAVIELLGYQIAGHSANEQEAIQLITKLKPDLVCLDIDLGKGGSGLHVAKHLHQNNTAPFLFITSMFDEFTISQARSFMPLGYIVKPFTAGTLSEKLNKIFEKMGQA